MKSISVTIPKIMVDLIEKLTSNTSQYVRLAIAKFYLTPDRFAELKAEADVSYDTDSPLIKLEEYYYVQAAFIGDMKKVSLKLEDEFIKLIEKDAELRRLSKSKMVSVIVCCMLADKGTMMCYRSLYDKVWLYKFWRDNYDEIHPDDPNQEYY